MPWLMRLLFLQRASRLGSNSRVVSGRLPTSLPSCKHALNYQGLHVPGWLPNYRCFRNASVPLCPSPCGSENDGWYFHVASQKGQNAMASPWLGGGEVLVLEGNLFHGFRGSWAVMNRLPLPVYKNIVCEALMYVGRTEELLKQMWGRYSCVCGSRPPLGASRQAVPVVKIPTWLKKRPYSSCNNFK